MRNILIIVLIALSLPSFGQAKLSGDTLHYEGAKYYNGCEVILFYGTKPNKDFAFISIGSGLSGVSPLESGWSKSKVTIDKIYKTQGKYYLRGKLVDSGVMLGNKIFIDIEGAKDNKEIL